jgi:hypothetical protein
MRRLLFQFGAIFILAGIITAIANEPLGFFSPDSINLINIFGVVVGGIVASAIVLAILVYLLVSGVEESKAVQ